jgi:hypothetical protein
MSECISIPEGLQVKQRGGRLERFEIFPAHEITVEQFQNLLNQIQVIPKYERYNYLLQ